MPWDDIARAEYARRTTRYASDLTDREWDLVTPFMPEESGLGRPRTTDLREVLNAILYIAATGCPWRYLPKDFPPVSTVQRYFYRWRDEGLWVALNCALVMAVRELEGREASPTAGVIDSQTVKTTEAGGVSGYDAGKKIKGRKRHIVVDTLGLMVGIVIHGADIQDRDGAPLAFAAVRHPGRGCATSLPPLGECSIRLPGNGWRLFRSEVAQGAEGAGRLDHRDRQTL